MLVLLNFDKVMDKYIDCVSMTTEVWDATNVVVFVNIVKDIAEKKLMGLYKFTVKPYESSYT